jgi:hypothetical protein
MMQVRKKNCDGVVFGGMVDLAHFLWNILVMVFFPKVKWRNKEGKFRK